MEATTGRHHEKEERLAIVGEIEKMFIEGASLDDALNKFKISPHSYSRWKKEARRMRQGDEMASYRNKDEIIATIEAINKDRQESDMLVKEACAKHGMSYAVYAYHMSRLKPRADKEPVATLRFDFIPQTEANEIIEATNYRGRFSEFHKELLEALKTAPEGQVPVIHAPRGATNDEIKSILNSTKNALTVRKMNWTVRYSQDHGMFVVYRKEKKNGTT